MPLLADWEHILDKRTTRGLRPFNLQLGWQRAKQTDALTVPGQPMAKCTPVAGQGLPSKPASPMALRVTSLVGGRGSGLFCCAAARLQLGFAAGRNPTAAGQRPAEPSTTISGTPPVGELTGGNLCRKSKNLNGDLPERPIVL